jgi:hypothetical protein
MRIEVLGCYCPAILTPQLGSESVTVLIIRGVMP